VAGNVGLSAPSAASRRAVVVAGCVVVGASTALPCYAVAVQAQKQLPPGAIPPGGQYTLNLWQLPGSWQFLAWVMVVIALAGSVIALRGDRRRVNNNGLLTGLVALVPLLMGFFHFTGTHTLTVTGMATPTTYTISAKLVPVIGTDLAFVATAFLLVWPFVWTVVSGRLGSTLESTVVPIGSADMSQDPTAEGYPMTTFSSSAFPGADQHVAAATAATSSVAPPLAHAAVGNGVPVAAGSAATLDPGRAPNIGDLPSLTDVVGSFNVTAVPPGPNGAPTGYEPGWRMDPAMPSRLRWWDGVQWTEHTSMPGA